MREIGIGLLGLGTVGSGVLTIIERRREEWLHRYGFNPIVKKILVKDLGKKRQVEVNPTLCTLNLDEVVNNPEIDIIIEVIGGEETALIAARRALTQNKHFITANKLMLAKHGPELFKLANTCGVELAFEASVGGGIPIIQPLRESLNANEVQSLMGIINGTTNFILTAMAQNRENYYDVLAKAQALGYAESDPTSDVAGYDARYKLSVLTGVAFGEQLPVEQIPVEGITKIDLSDIELAREMGYAVKLVAKAERGQRGVQGRVHPTLLPFEHPLAQVNGVNNALWVKGDAVGEVMFAGPGAGMMATGSAVTSDLVRVCRLIAGDQRQLRENRLASFTEKGTGVVNSCFFLTLKSAQCLDAGEIASMMYQQGIPLRTFFTRVADLYQIGIMTDFCAEQEVTQFIKNLYVDKNNRQIVYYYVEGVKPND